MALGDRLWRFWIRVLVGLGVLVIAFLVYAFTDMLTGSDEVVRARVASISHIPESDVRYDVPMDPEHPLPTIPVTVTTPASWSITFESPLIGLESISVGQQPPLRKGDWATLLVHRGGLSRTYGIVRIVDPGGLEQ